MQVTMRIMYWALLSFLFFNYPIGLSDVSFLEVKDVSNVVSPPIGQKILNETVASAISGNTSSKRNNPPFSRYLASDFHCVNNDGRNILCLQIENKLRITFNAKNFPKHIPVISLVCQNVKSSLDINYDFLSILQLTEEKPHALVVENCPVLNYSYASLFSSLKPKFGLRTTGSKIVLLLSNNSIKAIYLDWRIYMPRLQHIDLRYNKIEYITYQDMLFNTISYYEKSGFGRYPCSFNTTVDLRYNQIRGIEIPTKMLEVQPKKNESKGFYGHVTIMIDENPLECGCQVFNLLRVLHYDVALRSDLFLSRGEKWILPATLDIGNLSCSKPESIHGKKLNAIEEWIHHLLPMIAVCSMAGAPNY